jgi:hypothetical protein
MELEVAVAVVCGADRRVGASPLVHATKSTNASKMTARLRDIRRLRGQLQRTE